MDFRTILDTWYVMAYAFFWRDFHNMTVIKASDARARLYRLMDEAAESHEPVLITGKRSNAVLVSEEDWRSIQETLYLLSTPGMRESIIDELKTPVEKCATELEW